jgi:hypothetical protein
MIYSVLSWSGNVRRVALFVYLYFYLPVSLVLIILLLCICFAVGDTNSKRWMVGTPWTVLTPPPFPSQNLIFHQYSGCLCVQWLEVRGRCWFCWLTIAFQIFFSYSKWSIPVLKILKYRNSYYTACFCNKTKQKTNNMVIHFLKYILVHLFTNCLFVNIN